MKWNSIRNIPPVAPTKVEKPDSKVSPVPFILHTFLGTMFLVGCAIVIIFIGVFFFKELADQAASSTQASYEKTYETTYPNTSFNNDAENELAAEVEKTDVRMLFYRHELEMVTRNFIEADNAYDAFKADVKRELALSCIAKILTETTGRKSVGFHQVDGYKKNARNAYVKTADRKSQSMNNEVLMKKNSGLYSYPLSSGYGAYTLDYDFPGRCDEQMSVDSMYKKYLPIYMKAKKDNVNKRLASADKENDSSSRLSKYAGEVFAWLDIISARESIN